MAGNLQPLDQKFPIVKPDGKPTDYFIRWAQQRQIDIGNGITAEQAVTIIEQYLADHTLQPGSGIGITPSGNIADSPTIAAKVQEILDQITDVRGAILARGVAGWVSLNPAQGSVLFRGANDWQTLAPGTAGHFLKTNGAAADPAWAAGGGGSGGAFGKFAQSAPLAAAFGTTISGVGVTSTKTDVTGKGLALKSATTAITRGSGFFQAPPAAPFCMVGAMTGFRGMNQTTDAAWGIAFRNSTNGRMITNYTSPVNGQANMQTWSAIGTFNANLFASPNENYHSQFSYFALSLDVANNINGYYSGDGAQWELMGTTTLGAYLTAAGGTMDQVGLWLLGNAAAGRSMFSLCSFYRVDATIPPATCL